MNNMPCASTEGEAGKGFPHLSAKQKRCLAALIPISAVNYEHLPHGYKQATEKE